MYTTPKLPSDAYSKEFVNGKKGTIGNTVAFKAIPRSHALHLEDIKNTLAEKVDSGKYHPPQFRGKQNLQKLDNLSDPETTTFNLL